MVPVSILMTIHIETHYHYSTKVIKNPFLQLRKLEDMKRKRTILLMDEEHVGKIPRSNQQKGEINCSLFLLDIFQT